MATGYNTHAVTYLNFRGQIAFDSAETVSPYLRVEIYRCPNDDCKKETVIVSGINGYIGGKKLRIFPDSSARQFPDYIPQQIRSDYEEACAIVERSPKAAATLARRCLQGMIRDFWGICKGRLIDEINALQDKVTAAQWAAIDAIRKVGNIGAHMEKDVNLIVDVTPEEAQTLISMIELLLDKWYVARHDEQQLLSRVVAISDQKTSAKQS
nr:MAG TPA: protein of unknown function (DUF4145) [Caudoviricetes sp.]